MAKQYRETFKSSIIGDITQGSVFPGAISKFYENCDEIEGVIITPRCDIAQKKVSTYYYLPIIRWQKWYEVEFPNILIKRLEKQVIGNLKNVFLQNDISESLLRRYNAIELKDKISTINKGNIPKAIRKHLDNYILIYKYKMGEAKFDEIIENNKNFKDNVINEIISNKNPNYYLIENKENIFIIRIKELNRLTKEFIFKLAEGIEKPLTNEELKNNDIRQLKEDDLYYPTCQICSPYIEHIMQFFMQQFNKIGVEDLHEKTIKTIINYR